MLVATAVYLLPFVHRGWIPHDEGTLAGDAVRLMAGERPHVDFQDPYSGAMTWLYAALFEAFGVDLATIRWALFVAALVTTGVWFWIGLRLAGPMAAAGVAFVAMLWAFPNYFAGLPSWWSLTFATLVTAALIRFLETRREVWLVAAGLLVGVGCTFKQTCVYLLPAVALALTYDDRLQRSHRDGKRGIANLVLCLLLAGAALGGVAVLVAMHARLNMTLLLVPPIAAVALFVVFDEYRRGSAGSIWPLIRRLVFVAAGSLVPIAILIAPYVFAGTMDALVNGAWVLPQSRSAHAAYELPSPVVTIGLVPYVVVLCRLWRPGRSSLTPLAIIVAWLPLVAVVCWYQTLLGYRLFWNAIRYGLLLVLALLFLSLEQADATRPSVALRGQKPTLMALALMAAFFSLFQFPFAAPIYFCYVAPFVILALLGAVMSQQLFPRSYAVPLFAALAFFAVVSANRGYVETIGVMHRVVSLQTPLDIARASLRVSAADADTYRRVVNVVAAHARGPFVHAFPDCPEIYFLTDRRNPTPVNFEFFGPLDESVMRRLWDERHVTAIVLNHLPAFSPPPSASQLALARAIFPSGERVARFEVRWRALP